MRALRGWIVIAATVTASSRAAHGQAIDLFQGPVLGGACVIGAGGASVATTEGALDIAANPASPAVRAASSTDRWDWDVNFDWLYPGGSDITNTGIAGDSGTAPSLFTVRLVGQWRRWAIGTDFSTQTFALPDAKLTFLVSHVAIARSFGPHNELTVGLGGRGGEFTLAQPDGTTLFGMKGGGTELGVLWRPFGQDFRLGAAAATPIYGGQITHTCTGTCGGFTPPEAIDVTWSLALGGAWRLGPTPWNQGINTKFRDERSVRLAADVVLFGPVAGAISPQSYAAMMPIASGETASVSVRAGVEYEGLPGRLRVRGGGYWEPGRASGVGGRLHATTGVDVRVWSFRLWSWRYRLRISLFADVATRYWNGGASIGFWH